MQSKNEFTIVVLGSHNTGKTLLIEYFVFGANTKPTRPTIEDIYRKVLKSGKIINIIDTSGEQSTIDKLRNLYSSSADGYLIVFNAKDSKSLAQAKLEYEHVSACENPITVIATHLGAEDIDSIVEKKQQLFRKANFYAVDLNHREPIIEIFEAIGGKIKQSSRLKCRFCLCCC